MFCVNLCEFYSPSFLEKTDIQSFLNFISKQMKTQINRIYIGSSFCSQYFLQLAHYDKLFELCASWKIPITLTVPVFSEKDLSKGKAKLSNICCMSSGIIDEITVNDVGMLFCLQDNKKYKINLGRLFFKDPRDCRVPVYTMRSASPMLFSHLTDTYWSKYRMNFVELDPTNSVLNTEELKDSAIKLAVHAPFCYMTMGNICKFASIHKNVSQKFRPNLKCGLECSHIIDLYSGHIKGTNCDPTLLRLGRTLYFEMYPVKFYGKEPERIIYFPIKEWRKYVNENTGSVKRG